MKFITDLVKYFTFITTGIVIVFIVIVLIGGHDGISTATLIQIPCSALATSLVTVLFYPKESKTMKEYNLRLLLHYLVLCVVMVVLGTAFEWVNLNLNGILTMVISTAVVYIFTFTAAFLSSKHEADELNSALKNKHSKL